MLEKALSVDNNNLLDIWLILPEILTEREYLAVGNNIEIVDNDISEDYKIEVKISEKHIGYIICRVICLFQKKKMKKV